ncbi:ABC transporter substrate-binding protein [Cohnella sp. GCM10027633]|uniref:ABC transporter substrate-binding protein n=1 Tax=unclassified Cohnella TaxID=2636738 RepID=UPI0036281220
MKKLLVVTATAALLATSACGSNNNNGNDAGASPSASNPASPSASAAPADPFGKYDETISYTTVLATSPDPKFPAGESYESNKFTSYVNDRLNIKEEILWTAQYGDAFDQKLNLAIASDDLPDVFIIGGANADVILKRLVDNDMIADLSDVYQSYASELFRTKIGGDASESFKYATFGGKLMAIPNQMNNDGAELVWVRQDWLDKLKLPAPTTMDELMAVAKAFVEQDPDGNGKADTNGLGGQKDFIGVGGGIQTFTPIFSALNAFPLLWVPGADGKLQYGGVQPEIKDALAKLADMYKQGLIPKDFALTDFGKAIENVGSGTTGMLFQPWWAPTFPLMNALQNNANADWKAYPLNNANGEFINATNKATTSYVVVRKGFEHPELAMKYVNVMEDVSAGLIPELEELKANLYKDASEKNPFILNGAGAVYADTTQRSWLKFKDVLAGTADVSTLDPSEVTIYNDIKANRDNPKKELGKWATDTAWSSGIDTLATSNAKFVVQQFGGTTETMKNKWQALVDLQKETYVKIIMGNKPLEAFDEFVAQWKSQGGDQITTEVQAASAQ